MQRATPTRPVAGPVFTTERSARSWSVVSKGGVASTVRMRLLASVSLASSGPAVEKPVTLKRFAPAARPNADNGALIVTTPFWMLPVASKSR